MQSTITKSETSPIMLPQWKRPTMQDVPPTRLYYKDNEVAKVTGLTITRIQCVAEYLDIPKFISGNYKFKEKHIEKIIQADKDLREREDRKIQESEELAAKRKKELVSRKKDLLNQKKESLRNARQRTQEIERIQRRMTALGRYMNDQMQMLQEQMSAVARR
jgi:HSP90 family molecular chaperone